MTDGALARDAQGAVESLDVLASGRLISFGLTPSPSEPSPAPLVLLCDKLSVDVLTSRILRRHFMFFYKSKLITKSHALFEQPHRSRHHHYERPLPFTLVLQPLYLLFHLLFVLAPRVNGQTLVRDRNVLGHIHRLLAYGRRADALADDGGGRRPAGARFCFGVG